MLTNKHQAKATRKIGNAGNTTANGNAGKRTDTVDIEEILLLITLQIGMGLGIRE